MDAAENYSQQQDVGNIENVGNMRTASGDLLCGNVKCSPRGELEVTKSPSKIRPEQFKTPEREPYRDFNNRMYEFLNIGLGPKLKISHFGTKKSDLSESVNRARAERVSWYLSKVKEENIYGHWSKNVPFVDEGENERSPFPDCKKHLVFEDEELFSGDSEKVFPNPSVTAPQQFETPEHEPYRDFNNRMYEFLNIGLRPKLKISHFGTDESDLCESVNPVKAEGGSSYLSNVGEQESSYGRCKEKVPFVGEKEKEEGPYPDCKKRLVFFDEEDEAFLRDSEKMFQSLPEVASGPPESPEHEPYRDFNNRMYEFLNIGLMPKLKISHLGTEESDLCDSVNVVTADRVSCYLSASEQGNSYGRCREKVAFVGEKEEEESPCPDCRKRLDFEDEIEEEESPSPDCRKRLVFEEELEEQKNAFPNCKKKLIFGCAEETPFPNWKSKLVFGDKVKNQFPICKKKLVFEEEKKLNYSVSPLPHLHLHEYEEKHKSHSFLSDDSLNDPQDITRQAEIARKGLCTEYSKDVYVFLRKAEVEHQPKLKCMRRQPDIDLDMRSILVDWMVDIAEEHKIQNETLYLSVSLLDRFLSLRSVQKSKLQLVGTASMFVAGKYEEKDPLRAEEFVQMTANTYSKRQVLRMEQILLEPVDFNVNVPTVYCFLQYICCTTDQPELVHFLAQYLCELTLLDAGKFLKFLPSQIAAAAISLSRYTLENEAWDADLEEATSYNLQDLFPVIDCLYAAYRSSGRNPCRAIRHKYRTDSYHGVSSIPPPKRPLRF